MYCRGAACHTAKLSEGDVVLIRTLRALGLSYQSIARKFEVTAMAVWYAANWWTWAHVRDVKKVTPKRE